jgi:hypothetical protein
MLQYIGELHFAKYVNRFKRRHLQFIGDVVTGAKIKVKRCDALVDAENSPESRKIS